MNMPESLPAVDVLTQLFRSKDAVIGVIGLGYVGLPLAIAYSQSGYRVYGIDCEKLKSTGYFLEKAQSLASIPRSLLSRYPMDLQ